MARRTGFKFNDEDGDGDKDAPNIEPTFVNREECCCDARWEEAVPEAVEASSPLSLRRVVICCLGVDSAEALVYCMVDVSDV